MEHHEIEAVLEEHPQVRRSAVVVTATERSGSTMIAYVEGDDLQPARIRAYLLAAGLPAESVPQLVVPLPVLPLSVSGEVDRSGLPLPPLPVAAVGKSAAGDVHPWFLLAAVVMLTVTLVAPATLTDVLWPGSTDLTYVPSPWSWLFRGLYLAEWLSFSFGLVFLLVGRASVARLAGGPWWTTAVHLSLGWLLVAWWPQDNFYRLADKFDWPRQAALVYGFNITLMLAAATLAVFVLFGRRRD
ncbi:AMP-binding enzyme [Actinoplanes sichuanensis]|uniref:AMP-binding enzyme C-terminal domain-containing protein n=1 Tax=Actinoplanes sichuanensis TaxID=512349 RepID=A0ABW4ARI2_9ACTN|nr:hypothetical protein [Actinoplanes sichuanensis]